MGCSVRGDCPRPERGYQVTALLASLGHPGLAPIHHVSFDLKRPLTVITGANGAGKTTLLNIVTQTMGWGVPFMAAPHLGPKGQLSWLNGRRRLHTRTNLEPPGSPGHRHHRVPLWCRESPYSCPNRAGQLWVSRLRSPGRDGRLCSITHRIMSHYQQVAQLPTSIMLPISLLRLTKNELKNRHAGGHSPTHQRIASKSPSSPSRLLAMAISRPGKRRVHRDIRGLPRDPATSSPSLTKIQKLRIAVPEVIIETTRVLLVRCSLWRDLCTHRSRLALLYAGTTRPRAPDRGSTSQRITASGLQRQLFPNLLEHSREPNS